MAIACEACGEPVHEQVVVCPHCGERSGVAADVLATQQSLALLATDARPPVDSAIEALVGALGTAVDSALDWLDGDGESELPRAIARERPPRTR
jgi:hypothetical protein